MQILQTVTNILSKKFTFYFLLFIIGFISFIFFIINIDTLSGDHFTYLYYVKGLHQGRYSYWYFLKDYIPDTFRNPGYTFFLFFLSYINDSVLFIKIVQLVLLFLSIILMLKIIDYYDKCLVLKNLFLILVCINFVVLSYPAFIYPESLMIFLMSLLVFIELRMDNASWKKHVFLALLYGYCFQVRPVILFIPLVRFLYYLYQHNKVSIIKNVAFIIIFIATLLPYGFWNLKHHHQFKMTPLEGGGGVLYLGYWSPKMINYMENKYWLNITFEDAFINFVDKKEVPNNIKRFNNEWDSLEQVCSQYLTPLDIARLDTMKKYPDLFVTYNTKYTLEREKILKKLAIQHYLEDWQYGLKLKVYSFFRLWFTGLPVKEETGNHLLSSIGLIFAFPSTFITLLLFLGYLIFCFIKRRKIVYTLALPLLLCLYFDVLHIPFALQSRYTIPVRMLYLFSLVFMIYNVHFKSDETTEIG